MSAESDAMAQPQTRFDEDGRAVFPDEWLAADIRRLTGGVSAAAESTPRD